MKRFALVPHPAVTLALALAACGGGDLTLPGSAPPDLTLAVIDGNGQEGTVGDTLPSPLVVVVRSTDGANMAGQTVAFVDASGGATAFDPDTAVTNEQGQALTHWVLGTAPGSYAAEARLVSTASAAPPPVPLQASARPGAPDTVRADSPTLQVGSRGEPVGESPVVIVVDRFGNPVPAAEVKWKVEEGHGEVAPDDDLVTDETGRSTVTWTLGNRIGFQQLTAEVKDVSGSPVTFTATVGF